MHTLRLCLLLTCLLAAAGAMGHARLAASDPADGAVLDADTSVVTLRFSEGIQIRFSDFAWHFLGDDQAAAPSRDNRLPRTGASVDASSHSVVIPLLGDMQAGWYALDWEVLAEDGHTTRGTLRFRFRP